MKEYLRLEKRWLNAREDEIITVEEEDMQEIYKLEKELSKANDKLKKIEQLIENYSCIYKKGFPNHLLLVVRGKIFTENEYLELDTVLDDFEKIIKDSDK